ncbi:MAG TPA: DinB family protein [archaeon]|nr:DinB family protein [archaeon]
MQEKSFFERLSEFEHWANHEVITSLEPVFESADRPLKLFAHLLQSHLFRLDLLEGKEEWKENWWPELDFEECRQLAEILSKRWQRFFSSLDENGLDAHFPLKTHDGKTFEVTVRDLLIVLFTHSQYHRGQIALLLREMGAEPATTGYFAFLRRDNQSVNTES